MIEITYLLLATVVLLWILTIVVNIGVICWMADTRFRRLRVVLQVLQFILLLPITAAVLTLVVVALQELKLF